MESSESSPAPPPPEGTAAALRCAARPSIAHAGASSPPLPSPVPSRPYMWSSPKLDSEEAYAPSAAPLPASAGTPPVASNNASSLGAAAAVTPSDASVAAATAAALVLPSIPASAVAAALAAALLELPKTSS
eukprot:350109-Chlamydomonas_euryale.AAC.4